jgi:hypothetical protein
VTYWSFPSEPSVVNEAVSVMVVPSGFLTLMVRLVAVDVLHCPVFVDGQANHRADITNMNGALPLLDLRGQGEGSCELRVHCFRVSVSTSLLAVV